MKSFLLAAALGLSSNAFGQESTNVAEMIAARIPSRETGSEGDHLTGNWGGYRDQLLERGVHFSAGYTAELLGNISGGMRRGSAYQGLFEVALQLQTGKLGLYQGGLFHFSSLAPHGRGISGKYVGDLMGISNIEAYDGFRLYEAWYEHALWDGKLSIRAGQVATDEEFAYTETGIYFIHPAFGWPTGISANVPNGGSAFSVAAPGMRVRVDPSEKLYWQAGIYDGDPFDSITGDPRVNRSGTHWHLSAEQGYHAMTEAGLTINNTPEQDRLLGVYKIGAWYHSADYADNFADATSRSFVVTGNNPWTHSSNYGFYLSAEQMLCREQAGSEQGLGLFGRAFYSPEDRSLIPFSFDSGAQYIGLLPGRDEDRAGLGFAYGRLSRDLREQQRDDRDTNGADIPALADFEASIEAFYVIQLKKWWTVQPDVQYVIHPGGSTAVQNAIVVGVRSSIVF